MATHILSIAFDFDDDKVRAIAEKAVEQDMNTIIKNIILDRIAPEGTGTGYFSVDKGRLWDKFDIIVKDRVDEVLEDHKPEIIEVAANKLVESVKRTKVWKEKYKEVLE